MKMKKWLVGILLFCFIPATLAAVTLQDQLKNILKDYIKERHVIEHISAAAVTVSPARGKMMSAYAGTTEYSGKGKPIDANTLFQIGSITKSFTSVIILHLVAEGKLSLDDTVSEFFPEYVEWGRVSIRQLLNMTSGLPNYSGLPHWEKRTGSNIQHHFTARELVKAAYGQPMTTGYHYTNTGYILAGMIAEKITKKSMMEQIRDLIKSSGLKNTFYYESVYPKTITSRMPSGYYYNIEVPDLNPLIISKADPSCSQGKQSTDLKCNDMSWAGAAGGIVSDTRSVTQWARNLFTAGKILQEPELAALKDIISYKSARPIEKTSADDPSGFGLGVVQAYRPELGNYWYYQGETLGYRVLYLYLPKDLDDNSGDGLIITIALNSQPVSCEDHIGELMMRIYKVVKKQPKSSN